MKGEFVRFFISTSQLICSWLIWVSQEWGFFPGECGMEKEKGKRAADVWKGMIIMMDLGIKRR